jgi:hypothetical protein
MNECSHASQEYLRSRWFKAADGRRYLATWATCVTCGVRVETCLLKKEPKR